MKKIKDIELAFLSAEDYEDLKKAMLRAYPGMQEDYWREKDLKKLIKVFPEGQVVIKVNEKIAGCALSIIVPEKLARKNHTYQDITGNETFSTHNPEGNILYGIEVFIKPEFRGLRLGRRLYDYRKELCERLNLKCIMLGGRIPNYHKHAEEFTPKQYIEKVRHKEVFDPVLSFQLANDFHPSRVLRKYLQADKASNQFAILMEWDNIYYEEESASEPVAAKKVVRLGLIQWQMRPYKDMDDLMRQVEYFVDAVSGYRCDFALFPEFFNAPLMAQDNHLSEAEAIRNLAQYTPVIRDRFTELAISYNINIITGSMPVVRDESLYNVGYLCKRDGHSEMYEKLHVTPDEAKVWGLRGGNILQTYDTDCGKVGILICYDSEFPELCRLLADEGMDILFIPFLTDTQNGFSRVKNCAQARAIENECYVAIAGSVGNLPNVHNMDIQYAQSMVLTPCDFAFPPDGVKAEATPNTEMMLVVDVDIDLLRELNKLGSVRNLNDRRNDLFELKKKKAKGA